MKSIFLLGLVLAIAGCSRTDASASRGTNAAADNTKKNERDRAPTLTPGDQGNNEMDLGITQKIRQAVVKDDALSMTAKNAKIITVDGVVTLRGPVKSDKEKTEIGALAQAVTGVKRVDNQLEIATN